MQVNGYGCCLIWERGALRIWRAIGGRLDVTVPGRQVAAISVSLFAAKVIVTTAAGTRYKLQYLPWQAASVRAFRDAVLDGIAALG